MAARYDDDHDGDEDHDVDDDHDDDDDHGDGINVSVVMQLCSLSSGSYCVIFVRNIGI